MAVAPWTCENCGAVNAPESRVCVVCEAPAPHRERGRSRALWILATLMLVAVAAIGTTLVLASRHRPSTADPAGSFPSYTTPIIPPSTTASPPAAVAPPTTTSSTTPAGKPCPDDVVQNLPGGAGTALLVAQTEKFVVTICRTGDGQIFYHGQSRAQAGDITLSAQAEGDGFVAVNGTYRYTVGGGRLVVKTGGEVLSDDALTPVG